MRISVDPRIRQKADDLMRRLHARVRTDTTTVVNEGMSTITTPGGGINSGAITLNGDVTGPANNNVVRRIQTIPVSEIDPTDGQVLEYDSTEGEWTPATPTHPVHVGDVTGPHSATVVGKIQGIAVSGTDPTNGQVLVYNSSSGMYVPGTVGDIVGGGGCCEPVIEGGNGTTIDPTFVFDGLDIVMEEL